ncbi:DUF2147 domain-containing protein [Oryzifoliimicrobium ureilyticus]|uniref:DUF2147 domain-containing protein n=1 Tax=Oryzifoliimicrobium ureilyticus TaxID=3113724 RepID=UPI0030762386
MRTLIMAGILLASAGLTQAAEPIEGNWKTESGETASIADCGKSFCITLKSGKYVGKTIGKLAGAGNAYTGQVTDPENDKTYEGSAKISGASLKLQGCVLKVFCKTQTWTRL